MIRYIPIGILALALTGCAFDKGAAPTLSAVVPVEIHTAIAVPVKLPATDRQPCIRPTPDYTTKGGEATFIRREDDALDQCDAKRAGAVATVDAYDRSVVAEANKLNAQHP